MKKITSSFLFSLFLIAISTVQLTAQAIDTELQINDYDEPNDYTVLKNNTPEFYLAKGYKQQLDSFIYEIYDGNTAQWRDDQKYTFSYNLNEDITNRTTYIQDEISGEFVPDRNYEYAYNNNQELTLYGISDWNVALQQWIPDVKYEYTYDANENVTYYHRTYWDINFQQWVTDIKYEFTYDANGNRISLTYYGDWNPISEMWTFGGTSERSHDIDDKLVEEVNYNLDIYTQEFMLHQKINYTYDANDNQILSIDSIWMTDTQMWNPAGKSESTYNNNDNLTQTIYHIWDNITNAWRYSSKRDYDYDINGNAILELGSIWQIATNQWEQNFKAERTFDEANNEIGNAFYLWDNDQWIGSSNNVSAYNAAGNRTLNETYQGWDIYTEQWIGSTKREYAYDTNENYVLFNTYSWNSSTFEWENDYQLHFNYDNTYPYSELIIPYSEVSFRHKRTDYTRDEWDATTGQWTPDTARGTYYYSQQLVGIENIAETNINLFPNPAQDEVIFDLGYTPTPPMIELYNTQGQLTDIQPLNNNKISVKHLNSGIYFYQLFNGTQQYGGKLIVR